MGERERTGKRRAGQEKKMQERKLQKNMEKDEEKSKVIWRAAQNRQEQEQEAAMTRARHFLPCTSSDYE